MSVGLNGKWYGYLMSRITIPLVRKKKFHFSKRKGTSRECSKFHKWIIIINTCSRRHYMAEISPIRRKTLTINQSIEKPGPGLKPQRMWVKILRKRLTTIDNQSTCALFTCFLIWIFFIANGLLRSCSL